LIQNEDDAHTTELISFVPFTDSYLDCYRGLVAY
jgi:hypothetical protein